MCASVSAMSLRRQDPRKQLEPLGFVMTSQGLLLDTSPLADREAGVSRSTWLDPREASNALESSRRYDRLSRDHMEPSLLSPVGVAR